MRMTNVCVLTSVLLMLAALRAAESSLLIRDGTNPCCAYGNGTTFNISNLFAWPVSVEGRGVGGVYMYEWSCGGQNLPAGCVAQNSRRNPAVCQRRHPPPYAGAPYFDAGDVPGALWFADFNGGLSANVTWVIVYPNTPTMQTHSPDGGSIRVSRITFVVDPSVAEPEITMDGEGPYTEYSFTVRGKCIGQPQVNSVGEMGFCDPATASFTLAD